MKTDNEIVAALLSMRASKRREKTQGEFVTYRHDKHGKAVVRLDGRSQMTYHGVGGWYLD